MDINSLDVEAFRKLCGYDALVKKLDALTIQSRMISIGMQKKAQELVSEKAPEIGQVYIRDYSYFPRRRESFSTSKIKEIIAESVNTSTHVDKIIKAARQYKDVFAQIPLQQESAEEPFWSNTYIPPFDGILIYTMLAQKIPAGMWR